MLEGKETSVLKIMIGDNLKTLAMEVLEPLSIPVDDREEICFSSDEADYIKDNEGISVSTMVSRREDYPSRYPSCHNEDDEVPLGTYKLRAQCLGSSQDKPASHRWN